MREKEKSKGQRQSQSERQGEKKEERLGGKKRVRQMDKQIDERRQPKETELSKR